MEIKHKEEKKRIDKKVASTCVGSECSGKRNARLGTSVRAEG